MSRDASPAFPDATRRGILMGMGEIRPLPSLGDVFSDVRGDNRTMRISYHEDRGVVVVSLWAGGLCRGSFRLPSDDLDRLISVLVEMKWATPGANSGANPEVGTAPAATEPAGPDSGRPDSGRPGADPPVPLCGAA